MAKKKKHGSNRSEPVYRFNNNAPGPKQTVTPSEVAVADKNAVVLTVEDCVGGEHKYLIVREDNEDLQEDERGYLEQLQLVLQAQVTFNASVTKVSNSNVVVAPTDEG